MLSGPLGCSPVPPRGEGAVSQLSAHSRGRLRARLPRVLPRVLPVTRHRRAAVRPLEPVHGAVQPLQADAPGGPRGGGSGGRSRHEAVEEQQRDLWREDKTRVKVLSSA